MNAPVNHFVGVRNAHAGHEVGQLQHTINTTSIQHCGENYEQQQNPAG